MLLTAKTTIRWTCDGGNVVGAVLERQIDIPDRWGSKTRALKSEGKALLRDLIVESINAHTDKSNFVKYAYSEFGLDRVIQIKSRIVLPNKSVCAFLNLKGKKLENYIKDFEKELSYG